MRPCLENPITKKRASRVAQVVTAISNKCKVLSSKLSTAKKRIKNETKKSCPPAKNPKQTNKKNSLHKPHTPCTI
jgi:uncharacterized protein (DUF342 family)